VNFFFKGFRSITYFTLLAKQISYFAPQQFYGEVRKINLEDIFWIFSGSLLRHSVTVTATCFVEPRYRAPFDFHSTFNLGCLPAAMRNQNVYPYWLRLSFLRKCEVAWCHFEPGERRTHTITPTMSNCYHGSSSDRFHSKKHVK